MEGAEGLILLTYSREHGLTAGLMWPRYDVVKWQSYVLRLEIIYEHHIIVNLRKKCKKE